VTYAGIKQR